MRVTVIHNPQAGEGRPARKDLEKILQDAGLQVRYVSSQKNWKNALRGRTELAVAAGGDGTVAKVLLHMRGSDIPVALLPLGTANNVARTLGVIGNAQGVAGAWRVAAVKPFDIGRLRAPWGEERFVESFGGGIFGESIVRGRQEVEDPGAFIGPEVDRAMLLLREVAQAAQPRSWQIDLDGKDLSGEYLAVEVLNIRFAGPNIPLAPEADPGDGLLDLVLVGEEQRQSLLDHLSGRLEQAAALAPDLIVKRGRKLTLSVGRPFPPLHIDDDVVGHDIGKLDAESEARFKLEFEPGAVKVLRAEAQVDRQA
jgi:diacylglycerol kinase (ATP)